MDKKHYKVGDRVRIVDKWTPGCFQNIHGHMDKWLGKVMTVRQVCGHAYRMEEDRHEQLGHGWVWHPAAIAGLAEQEKIIITTDGKTTLARRYIGGNLTGKAEAKLAPGDVFDFDTGARLAFGRLVGPAYDPDEVKLTKPADGLKVGDRVRIKNIPVKAWKRLAGAEGTLVHNDGTGFAPWVVELDRPRGFGLTFTDPDRYGKKGHCIWAEPHWLVHLPQPDEAKVKNPLLYKEIPCGPYIARYNPDGSVDLREQPDEHLCTATLERTDEHLCTATLEQTDADSPTALAFLHMLRDNLQEVTFTADGDIIAKFK